LMTSNLFFSIFQLPSSRPFTRPSSLPWPLHFLCKG